MGLRVSGLGSRGDLGWVRIYGLCFMALWLSGFMALWLYGFMAFWFMDYLWFMVYGFGFTVAGVVVLSDSGPSSATRLCKASYYERCPEGCAPPKP